MAAYFVLDVAGERGKVACMDTTEQQYNTDMLKRFAQDVLTKMGPGHSEEVYDKAMQIAFQHVGLAFRSQPEVPLTYMGVYVGVERPDFFVGEGDDLTIVELKAIMKLGAAERAQVKRYMRLTGISSARLINFPANAEEVVVEFLTGAA